MYFVVEVTIIHGSEFPADYRYIHENTFNDTNIGFRVVLFIK